MFDFTTADVIVDKYIPFFFHISHGSGWKNLFRGDLSVLNLSEENSMLISKSDQAQWTGIPGSDI